MTNEEKLYIDTKRNHAVLFGYILPLTKTEFAILKLIRANDGYTSAYEIANRIFCGKSLTHGNVAVHVCNINKKAMKIRDRAIIQTCRYKGYKLSDII